jgi:hypothetical protein
MAQGKGATGWRFSHRRDALDEALGRFQKAVFIGDHVQVGAGPQQLARLQQEVRPRGLPTDSLPIAKVS